MARGIKLTVYGLGSTLMIPTFKHITNTGLVFIISIWTAVNSLPAQIGSAKENYAIVVDAGSSGSRMFVYVWMSNNASEQLPNLELLLDKTGQPTVKKINPGLSSFASKLDEIPAYITRLLEPAVSEIPSPSQNVTPLYIFATAGMRLLTEVEQENIWHTVRKYIKKSYKFSFHDANAKTISGAEEALYGWIAVNVILGRFSPDPSERKRKMTYGVLDLGGASVQLAFELRPNQQAPDGFVKRFSLRFKQWETSPDYSIYLVSYLNYGANVMRSRYERFLLYNKLKGSTTRPPSPPIIIPEPCLSNKMLRPTTLVPRSATDVTPPSKTEKEYDVVFEGTGNYDLCQQAMYPLLNKQNDCKPYSCAIGHTPQADIDFSTAAFYGLTEFYYSLHKFLQSSNYSYEVVSKGLRGLCAETLEDYGERKRKAEANLTETESQRELTFRQLACFKGTYTISLLHSGFNFPKTYERLMVVEKLNNTDVQWSLGALFYMLNAVPEENLGGLLGYQIALITLAVLLFVAVIVTIVVVCYSKKLERDMLFSEPSTIADSLSG